MNNKVKPPIVTFRESEPLNDYYCDINGDRYSVARLVNEAKDLATFDCPLAALQLSDQIWVDADIYELAYHCRRVKDADLSKPIILDWRGNVADGRHRIIKALVEGKPTIKAVKLTWRLTPCSKAINTDKGGLA